MPALDLSPIVLATADLNRPSGLRSGQTLTLLDGGELGMDFEAIDSTLNVEGGTIGITLAALNSTVNISSGSVGNFFEVLPGSSLNVSGGSVGRGLNARSGGIVDISGGEIDTCFTAHAESLVSISGGSIGDAFEADPGSVVNISGGSIGSRFVSNFGSETNISGGSIGRGYEAFGVVNISGGEFDSFNVFSDSVVNISGGTFERLLARTGSEINVFGSNFAIDGEPLDSLMFNDPFTIVDRDVILTGLLVDGSEFQFVLRGFNNFSGDHLSPDATLNVTLVAPVVLGDVDQNGVVDFADIPAFIEVLQTGMFLPEADINQDGVVNFDDIPGFIEILTAA